MPHHQARLKRVTLQSHRSTEQRRSSSAAIVLGSLATMVVVGLPHRSEPTPWRTASVSGTVATSGLPRSARDGHPSVIQPKGTGGPRLTLSSPHHSSTPFIYGISGTFASHCSATTCTGLVSNNSGSGPGFETAIGVQAVANGEASSPSGLGGRFLRIGVTLSCDSSTPGPAWWGSSDQNPYLHDNQGQPIDADPHNVGSILDLLTNVNGTGLTPIIDVLPNPLCDGSTPQTPNYSTPGSWFSQLQDLVRSMNTAYPLYKRVYFEIGNEENYNPIQYGRTPSNYARIFASAAQGIQAAMPAWNHDYYILTGGMLRPSALAACVGPPAITNIEEAQLAILTALSAPFNLSRAHLGVAVHPYFYATADAAQWLNYAGYNPVAQHRACFDLGSMLNLWANLYFPGLQVVVTELDWSDHPPALADDAESAYLVDLFSWLYDNPGPDVRYARSSHIRVAWFRGNDADLPLGIYYARGQPKAGLSFLLPPQAGVPPYCANTSVTFSPTPSLPHDFYWLRLGTCYP